MTDLRSAAEKALKALEGWKDDAPSWWTTGDEKTITALRAALEQPEPDIYALPTNRKEPRPGLVNLEEFPGFLYESPNGWHIGDMKVVKWLLNNREADYWKQFKEKP